MTVQTVTPKLPRIPGPAWTVAAVLVVDALVVGWVLFAESGRASADTVYVVNVVLNLIVVAGMFAYLVPRWRYRPARLVPRQDRFVAPAGRLYVLLTAGPLFLVLESAARPATEFWSRDWTDLRVEAFAVAALLVTVQLASAVLSRDSIELDPAQVRLSYGLTTVTVPWAALAGELDSSGGWGIRRLRVTAPEQVTRRGLTGRLDLGDPPIPVHASVNRAFLAAVIRYYVEHPEHRQEIGTKAGYDRLVRDIGAVSNDFTVWRPDLSGERE